MSITPATKTKIRERIAKYEALRDKAEDDLAALNEIESYTLDTGEGTQRTKFRSPEELLE